MMSGTAAGQAVVLAFAPLITRIYGPEAFGLQGTFLALISILGPAIALRYPLAIVIAEDEEEAAQLARMSLLIAFSLSCGLGLVLLIAVEPLRAALGAEELGGLVWLLPVALFAVAAQEVANYRAARATRFGLIARVKVLQAFGMNLARVLGGLVAPVAGVLLAVTSIAPFLEAMLLARGAPRRHPAPPVRWYRLVSLMRTHRDFPLYRAPTDVLHALAASTPVLVLSFLFTPAAAGFYVLARSAVSLPVNIVGSAVGNVYYARFAAMARKGEQLLPLIAKATLAHFLLLAVPVLLISALFPTLFTFVFGDEWRLAGEFAQWMALWVGVGLVNGPSVRVLPVIGRQGFHLLFRLLFILCGLAGLMAGYMIKETPLAAVAGYSLAIAPLSMLQLSVYLLLTHNHDRMLR